MYDRILLPTDGSDRTRRAITQASALADAVGARIHAIHVVDERVYESLSAPDREARDADAQAALAAVERAAPDHVPVERSLRYGVVHEEILAAATVVDADAVVVAAHRRTGLERLLAGSTAELVARRATVPVLIVGPDDAESSPTTDDFRDRAADVLATAGREAAEALAEPYRTT